MEEIKYRMVRLDNGTVDNVNISKIHHDKCMNECTKEPRTRGGRKTKNTTMET